MPSHEIRPDQINALVKLLRDWGYEIPDEAQQDLIDEFEIEPKAVKQNQIGKFSRKSLASKKAALKIFPRSGTQRSRVYTAISSRGNQGISREEIAQQLGMSENSVRPRVAELLEGEWIFVGGTTQNSRGQEVELLKTSYHQHKGEIND